MKITTFKILLYASLVPGALLADGALNKASIMNSVFAGKPSTVAAKAKKEVFVLQSKGRLSATTVPGAMSAKKTPNLKECDPCYTVFEKEGILPKKTVFIQLDKLGKKRLSDEEIDKVFLSFVRQKELEAKRKKEEEERRIREKERLELAKLELQKKERQKRYSRTIMEADKKLQKKHILTPEEKRALEKKRKEEERRMAIYQAEKVGLYVYGTSCKQGMWCEAFTSLGTLKKGKTIPQTGEKIIEIYPDRIVTNLRKIRF